MAQCQVMYYDLRISPNTSEPRCRCTFHGVDYSYSSMPTQTCPVGHLENRILGLETRFADLFVKVADVDDRIEKHEQDYYNAQHPQNVRSG